MAVEYTVRKVGGVNERDLIRSDRGLREELGIGDVRPAGGANRAGERDGHEDGAQEEEGAFHGASVKSTDMISHEIVGDDMQAVIMTLGAGDEVRAEAGAMTFMTDGIEMDARLDGGLLGGLKRKFLAGESLFLTYFKSSVASARVAFSGPYPGKIIRFPLQNSSVLCQRDSFLCAAGTIDINIAFTKRLGAGFFGGGRVILQKAERPGGVFVHSGGTDHSNGVPAGGGPPRANRGLGRGRSA